MKPSPGSNDAVDSPFELSPLTTAATFHEVDATSQRPVYPYSIIPGGVVSVAELRSAMLDRPVVSQIEPFVPPIAGEIEGGIPAGALFLGPTGAAGSGGGTIGGPAISAMPINPMTGGESSSPGSPPPISTPEPASLILLSTGLGAACLFRKPRKT